MLRSLFSRHHRRFLSLALLGPVADDFDDWLASNGYTQLSRKHMVSELRHVNAELRSRRIQQIPNLTSSVLHDCWRNATKKHPYRAATVRALERYLIAKGLIAPAQPGPASTTSALIEEYANFLREVRGLVAPTISRRRYTARCFLQHLEEEGIRLKKIQATQIESYITQAGRRLSRATLQLRITELRSLLRFLAMDGRAPDGLANRIDTPCLYRMENLPRSLPWETVRALLRSIDRTSARGLRDYAIFLLMATYGLRTGEVVAITLDDLHWRHGNLRVHQGKTSSLLELPLTNEVLCALVKHLKRTPPPPPQRKLFMRMHAPVGVLKPTAIHPALQYWIRRSGLRIPIHLQGPHCLRHSLAVHLLRNGTPLKTISDILGHRSAKSTSTYLRLATSDLREVPLAVPSREHQGKQVQR